MCPASVSISGDLASYLRNVIPQSNFHLLGKIVFYFWYIGGQKDLEIVPSGFRCGQRSERRKRRLNHP